MEKQSSSDYHKYNHGEFEVSVDIATLEEFSHLLQSQPKKLYSESWRRRQIQKVPPQIRRRINMQRDDQIYDPVMVSIGPYHHGKPELRRAEEFKHLCLDWRAGGDEKKKALFYSKILEQIGEIRDSYAEVTIVEKYDDKSLALMMLLDASMIIDFIHNYNYQGMKGKSSSFLDWQRCLGARSGPLMVRDMMVMENQIPFQVLKMLINLLYEREEAGLFLPRFLSHKMGIELKHAGIPQEKEDPPIHFLESFWRVLVKKRTDTLLKPEIECSNNIGGNRSLVLSGLSMREEMNNDTDISYTHRSVMDLKAKGIRVMPNSNSTLSPRDITFRPSGGCFSQLQLPIQYVSDQTLVVCSNMIAFEVLPYGCTSLVMLSYVIFMKSLIQSPEDVKELQERGVLLNRLANLEKVVEVFKEIDTFGLHDQDIFKDVKRRIEEHCSSRAKTWFAELIYTRFRTPWTAIALFAAVILLCLTFLQTFFTIRR
ncbi:hypothetical protein C2S51_010582 [Perilla frutescens var. frutescens]|nr:hypothetical protein C2S51_010582 [Perilla frutescens var. frutescens]